MLHFIQKFPIASSETLENFLYDEPRGELIHFLLGHLPRRAPICFVSKIGDLLCVSIVQRSAVILKKYVVLLAKTIKHYHLPSPPHGAQPGLIISLVRLSHHVPPPLLIMETETHHPSTSFHSQSSWKHFPIFLGGNHWGFIPANCTPDKPDLPHSESRTSPEHFHDFAFFISERFMNL